MRILGRKKGKNLLQVKKFFYILLILFISYLVSLHISNTSYSFTFFKTITAKVLALLLHGKVHGTIIELPSYNLYIEIIKDCVGWKTLLALITLWLISPFNSKIKVVLILLSFPLAFLINITRILVVILLTYISSNPSSYYFYDNLVFKAFNVPLIVLIYFFIILSLRKKTNSSKNL